MEGGPAPAPHPVRPLVLAGERTLPVLGPLADLFPGAGLRRGSVVTVSGSLALVLALAAGPSAAGSWCAAVGLDDLGVMAAAEMGVCLDRLALVEGASPAADWAWTVAAVVDGFDLVLVSVPAGVTPRLAQGLTARVRRRSSVLVAVAGPGRRWPSAELDLVVGDRAWEGLGRGEGRLSACRVEVSASGRGASSAPRRLQLWLPDAGGGVSPVEPLATAHPLRTEAG